MTTTTLTTPTSHTAFERAALWLSLLALLAAVGGLAVAVTHVFTTAPVTTVSAPLVVDNTAKVSGGYVRPFETGLEQDSSYVVTYELPIYADLPTGHLQPGPVH